MRNQGTRILVAAGLVVFASRAPAQIQFESVHSEPVASGPSATVLTDLDADGDLDLVVSASGPARLELLINQGTGHFVAASPVLIVGLGDPGSPAAGDLDGDGDVDLAVTLTGSGQVAIYENVAGSYSLARVIRVGGRPTSLVVADLDGDGDFDLVNLDTGSNSVSIATNLGGLMFRVRSLPLPVGVSELVVAELTGDGLLDLAISNQSGGPLTVLANQGGGAFVALSILPDNNVGHTIMAGDVDGDGDTDLISTSGGGIGLGYFIENQAPGVFLKHPPFFLTSSGTGYSQLADLDGDGDLDLALASLFVNSLVTWSNDGTGVFGGPQFHAVTPGPTDISIGDLDGDGAADVVVTAEQADEVVIAISAAAGTPCDISNFCVAKVNSLGQRAAIGATNHPSFGAQSFAVNIRNAVPGATAIAFFSTSGPAMIPFANGFLCIQQIKRLPLQVLDAAGRASVAVPIAFEMVGTQRWYQWWYRDPQHLDGTGVGLSDGLSITFCD